MENYNGLTMSPSGDGQNLPTTMNHPVMNEGYTHDPTLEFGQVMFNDLNVDLSQLPDFPTHHQPYDFSANFEDPLGAPWANNASYFEGTSFPDPTFQIAAGAEASPPDLDNKLLGFGAPIHKTPVIDAVGQSWPRLCAELNGMFSIAEDVFEGETTGRPLELTCYRRNLFQISGSIAMSRSLARVVLDQGRNANITELYASLSATESIEGKHTDIISVPWKTGIANGASSEDKSGTSPAPIPIDLSSNQEADPIQVTIPIAWRRLQFKYATANNGRRKGLQQHYQVQIALMAKVEGEDQPVKIAEIHSNNIVVRGRSPKNFDSSKDVPLSERKQSDPMNRRGQAQQGTSISSGTPQQQQQWGVEPAIIQASGKYYAQSFQTSMESLSTWPHMSPTPAPPHVPITRSPPAGNHGLPPAKRSASTFIPSRRRPTSTASIPNIPNMPRHLTAPDTIAQIKSEIAATPSASHRPPIGLSLSDDSPPTHISLSSDPSQSPEAQHTHTKSPTKRPTAELPPQTTHWPSVTSPMEKESIDQLYEYFPLSLDDWMPPVDAIYRPHVVHHLKVAALGGPPGGGVGGGGGVMFAGMGRQRPKRYFSGGDE